MLQKKMFCYLGVLLAACVSYLNVAKDLAFANDESNPLALLLAKRTGQSEAQAEVDVEKLFSIIRTEMRAGNAVSIKNFGRFYVQMREVKPRAKKNGQKQAALPVNSGEKGPVPQTKRFLRFVSDKVVKDELNERKS